MGVHCNYCSKPAELVSGKTIYPHRKDLYRRKYWLCRPCGAYVGCHAAGKNGDGTKPLGELADLELRRARNKAHAMFDPLWKEGRMKRGSAYRWLSRVLGIRQAECHIGMFDVNQCEQVVDACIARGRK